MHLSEKICSEGIWICFYSSSCRDSLRFSLKAPWAFSALCPSSPSSSAQIPLPIHLVYVQTYLETYMKYHFLIFSWWSLTQPDPAPARKCFQHWSLHSGTTRGQRRLSRQPLHGRSTPRSFSQSCSQGWAHTVVKLWNSARRKGLLTGLT